MTEQEKPASEIDTKELPVQAAEADQILAKNRRRLSLAYTSQSAARAPMFRR